MAPFHSYIHRLLTFPLCQENFIKEVNTIKEIARNNGYNDNLIDKLIKNKQKKNIHKEFYAGFSQETKNYKCINYRPKISNKVSHKLNQLGCRTISVNKNNLGKMLINNKDKTEKLDKTGVYQLNCDDCDAIYIGQTGRNLKKRLEEHKKSILNNVCSTGMSTHCIENNHFINLKNVELLHSEKKGRKLDMLEQLEILKALKTNKNVTNDQQIFTGHTILHKII